MGDTILLATSRERCIEKLDILCEFCSRSGMVINASKTKFMVINGNVKDREPLVYGNIVVQNCDSYIYLGAVFTQDGSTETSVSEHLLSKQPHVLKFNAFITKNVDFPFWIKQKVFHAALLPTILYSSEAWLGNSARNAQTAYYSVVKTLLGVRVMTANELCLMELGIPSVVARVRDAQKKFLDKLLKERQIYEDDPFMKVWRLCSTTRTPGFLYLRSVLEGDDQLYMDAEKRKDVIRRSTRTKYRTYAYLNPNLTVHPMYVSHNVPDHERRGTTRLRLSSHNLAIETGRWARVAPDQRLCACGAVQTEEHVICDCPYTGVIRADYPTISFANIVRFFQSNDIGAMCNVVNRTLRVFEN